MEDTGRTMPLKRAGAALAAGGGSAWRSLLRLVAVLIPLSLVLGGLDCLGAFGFLDRLLGPVTAFVGLPGSAIIVLLASALIDVYAGAAAVVFLSIDYRSAVILAAMCLAIHGLVRETAAMRKTGSSGTKMVLLRLAFGLGAGWGIHLILPPGYGFKPFSVALGLSSLPPVQALGAWAGRVCPVSLKIAVVVFAVGALRIILAEFRGLDFLAKVLAPFMRFLGLDPVDALYWNAANAVGYLYCAGLVTGDIESGRIKRQDGDLFNHNALLCHSLVEETAFFMLLGLPLFWLVIPRLVMSAGLTWMERFRRRVVRRSFRAGVA